MYTAETINNIHFGQLLKNVTQVWLEYLLRQEKSQAKVAINGRGYLVSECLKIIRNTKQAPSIELLERIRYKGVSSRAWCNLPAVDQVIPYLPNGDRLIFSISENDTDREE